jgi:predicted ester cyclase
MPSNKELVHAMIDQVWNAGRVDRLPEFWAEESRAEAERLYQTLTGAFPDLRVQIEDLVAEDDRVVARLTFEGTHRGAFRGIEPTGRTVRFGAIRIYRLTDGKVVETWAQQDALGLIQQLRTGA